MSINSKMTAIADNIRSKTGGTEALTLDDMASGVNEVYETGKYEGQKVIWDEIIASKQKRVNFKYAFSYWGASIPPKDVIEPPLKITPTDAQYMFNYCKAFSKIKAEHFDLSNAKNSSIQYCFYFATQIEEIEDVGIGVNGISSLYYTFYQCQDLKKIAKITVQETTTYIQAFQGDLNLEYVRFEGVIGKTIDFKACAKLSLDSMKNVINHLKDYTGDEEFVYTVTFNNSAFNALEAEGATAEYNGAACTWAELIGYKKWNLSKLL